MCLCVHAAFCGNGASLVYYNSVSSVQDVFVGKGQVLLEDREHCSVRVPRGRHIAVGRPARTDRRACAHTHTKGSRTCSQCNLWWQSKASLGSVPGSGVITVFPLWSCECVCECVLLTVYPSTMSKCCACACWPAVISLTAAVGLQDSLPGREVSLCLF